MSKYNRQQHLEELSYLGLSPRSSGWMLEDEATTFEPIPVEPIPVEPIPVEPLPLEPISFEWIHYAPASFEPFSLPPPERAEKIPNTDSDTDSIICVGSDHSCEISDLDSTIAPIQMSVESFYHTKALGPNSHRELGRIRIYQCSVSDCDRRDEGRPHEDVFRIHITKDHPNEDVTILIGMLEVWADAKQGAALQQTRPEEEQPEISATTYSPDSAPRHGGIVAKIEDLEQSLQSYRSAYNRLDRAGAKEILEKALFAMADSSPSPTRSAAYDYIKDYVNDSGETVFRCKWPSCHKKDQSWVRCSAVEKHVMRHSRPFGCTFDYCHRRFGSKTDWIRHETKCHTHKEYWRCGLTDKTGVRDVNCGQTFITENMFKTHLKKHHNITNTEQCDTELEIRSISANFLVRYWCGFCRDVQQVGEAGTGASNERYDHISKHMVDKEKPSHVWYSPHDLDLVRSKRRDSHHALDTNSSEDSDDTEAAFSPKPQGWRHAENLSKLDPFQGALESGNTLTSRLAGELILVTRATPPAEDSREAAQIPLDAQSNRLLRMQEPSVSESNKSESRESDGELEFMGLTGDGVESPGYNSDADHDFMVNIVAQLVEAYLRVLELRRANLRRCANNTDTSQTEQMLVDSGAATQNQSARAAPSQSNKRGREEEDDYDVDKKPASKRLKSTDEDDENKSFACPYSKYDPARYSKFNANPQERNYRRCASSYLKDIPRVKQHLYRTHKRPEPACGRCFTSFTTQAILDRHIRSPLPCELGVCPLPERMTANQKLVIKRRSNGKNQEAAWFFIYETLFPGSTKPSSPYAEVASADAVSSFRQWYEDTEAVAILRQSFDSRLATFIPDESEQVLIRWIFEESISDLALQRGPSFHLGFECSQAGSQTRLSSDDIQVEEFESEPSSMTENSNTSSMMSSSTVLPTDNNSGPSGDAEILAFSNYHEDSPFLQEDATSREVESCVESEMLGKSHQPLLRMDVQDFSFLDMVDVGSGVDYEAFSDQQTLLSDASSVMKLMVTDLENQSRNDLSRKTKGKEKAWG